MIKILLLPPILVSIYLVVINWSGMYQKPDIIGMPVVFEIMAFVLYFLVAVPIYWLLVCPTNYLVLKSSGSRYAGIVFGLMLAIALPCYMSTLDYPDFSWAGTLSRVHVTMVFIPMLFLTIYG